MKNPFKLLFKNKTYCEYANNIEPVNGVRVIACYRTRSSWCFDDPSVGLFHEPFVYGTENLIDYILGNNGKKNKIKEAIIQFSDKPFDGHMYVLNWVSKGGSGEKLGYNSYSFQSTDMIAWLCPQLYKYFNQAPEKLYVSIQGGHS